MSVEDLIVISNIALVVVTAFAAYVSFQEAHRHEERQTDQMAEIVHEVMEQERRMEHHEEMQDKHETRNK